MFAVQTEWDCPEDFPNLSDAKFIAIDLETKDPDLKAKGSGAIQGHGEIVGIAVAVEGWSGYYPIAHEGGGNMDKKNCFRMVQESLCNRCCKNISQCNVRCMLD